MGLGQESDVVVDQDQVCPSKLSSTAVHSPTSAGGSGDRRLVPQLWSSSVPGAAPDRWRKETIAQRTSIPVKNIHKDREKMEYLQKRIVRVLLGNLEDI